MRLFELRAELDRRMQLILAAAGVAVVLVVWHLLTTGGSPFVEPAILPHPWRVLMAFGDRYRDNDIIRNTCRSLGINLAGYVEALLIALPLGFLIGLFPLFRGGFQKQVESLRYVPLTAVTGLFIVWFGVGVSMKVHFLAFGILIYLLPVIVQRIDDVEDVYLKTVYTLGASPWQTIRTVYWPAVVSRLSDDVRVLTAISWTYIIVAENIDSSQGGLGALIWRVGQRQGRMDKVFALLLLIVLIGVVQDRLFKRADGSLFPYKRAARLHGVSQEGMTTGGALLEFISGALTWTLLGAYWVVAINDWTGWLIANPILSYLFGETVWAVHLVMLALTAGAFWRLWRRNSGRYGRVSAESLPANEKRS